MNIEDLKAVVRNYGLQADVLRDLCGVPQEVIDAAEGRKEGPGHSCPYCGGKDRFKIIDLAGDMKIFCRQGCFEGKKYGDEIDGIMKAHNLADKGEAKRELEEWLIDRGYLSEPRQRKQGGYKLTKTTKKQAQEHDADDTLTLTASGVEYEDDNVSRRLVKTTFYHRLNPKTNFISTFRRDDFDAPKPKNKETKWVTLEKDAQGNSIYAPYLAGGATTTEKPPKDALERLYDDAYHATRFYLVEGEKCAESLKNAVKSTDYDGAVMTLGASGNAHLWTIWAAFLKRKNPNAEVVIFADNDACGRKAANETASAFHAAGYRAIEIIDLARLPNGADAPKAYDVADWLENAPISPLFELARPYDYLADEYRKRLIKALTIRKDHALRLERAKAEREALGFDYRDDNAAFPVEVVPAPYLTALEQLSTKYRVPLGVCNFFLDDILSATVGAYKCEIHVSDDIYNCQLSGIVVGRSGVGKSKVVKELLTLVQPFQRSLNDEFMRLVNREEKLEKELEDALAGDSSEEAIALIKKKLRIIGEVKPSFVVSDFTSVASLRAIGAVNCVLFEIIGGPLNGMFLFFDDALKLLATAGTTTLDATTAANLKGIFALSDYDLNQSEKVSDKGRGKIERERIAASVCFLIQQKTFKAWSSESIVGTGAMQRQRLFFCDRARHDKSNPVNPCAKYRDALEPIGDLFTQGWNWTGGKIEASQGYQNEYTRWFNDAESLKDDLLDRGEEFLEGWVSKRQGDVHAEAFLSHVKRHVANGGTLDSLPPLTAEAFHDAEKLFYYELEAARRVASIMDVTQAKSKKAVETVVNVPLGEKIRNVYEIGCKGEPCDLATQGDELGRARTVTELNEPNKGGTTYYKRNKETVDGKLVEHGLLVIDPRTKGKNDKGRRVFLPDDLTSEQYDRMIRILDFEDVEEIDVSEDAEAEEEVPF